MICWRHSDRTATSHFENSHRCKKANFLVRENSCCYSFCHLVFSLPCMKTLKGSLLAFIYDIVYAANMWHIAKPEVTAWIPHPFKFQIWTILLDNLHKHIQNVNIISSSMALKELNSVNDNDTLPPLVHMHYFLITVVFLFLSVLSTYCLTKMNPRWEIHPMRACENTRPTGNSSNYAPFSGSIYRHRVENMVCR